MKRNCRDTQHNNRAPSHNIDGALIHSPTGDVDEARSYASRGYTSRVRLLTSRRATRQKARLILMECARTPAETRRSRAASVGKPRGTSEMKRLVVIAKAYSRQYRAGRMQAMRGE